jgi:hypothetical protein
LTRSSLAAFSRAAVVYAAGAALLVAVAHVTSWWVTGAIAVALTGYGVWWCWSRMFRWGRPW